MYNIHYILYIYIYIYIENIIITWLGYIKYLYRTMLYNNKYKANKYIQISMIGKKIIIIKFKYQITTNAVEHLCLI